MIRSEETKRSRTYLVAGTRDNGEECQIVVTISAQCQVPGSKKAVEDNFTAIVDAVDSCFIKEKSQ